VGPGWHGEVKLAILAHMHHPIAEPFEGGTEAHTAMLANALVARGHDVTLFAKEGSTTAATVYPLVPKDFEFVRAATPLVRIQQAGFLAEAVHHSIRVIQSSDFDVVINNSLSSLPYTFMRAVPMMTILHTPPTLSDVNAILTRPRWKPSAVHAYVTVSETNAAAWRTMLPSVQVVYNGIALESWHSSLPASPNLAVWAARITPEKGLHLAIDAARLAGMRFEFAGPVSNTDYFHDQIVPRMGPDVVYRGHLSHHELQTFLGSATVFVASPIWAEPFGLSVVEALASGTPVAAFPNGALPEIVTSEAGAVSVDTTAESLASAMLIAATSPRAGARRASERFDFETMIDGYERVVTQVAVMPARAELV
jgi:glycosyltransferase involved in cell wall biosynthesis